METLTPWPGKQRPSWGACLVALLSLALLPLLLLRSPGDLAAPLVEGGDPLFFCRTYKSMLEHGTLYRTPELGAPGVATHYGFPLAFGLDQIALWCFAPFTHDVYVLYNLIYLASLPACALAAWWSLRRLGVGSLWSGVAALLYAYLPNHLARYEHSVLSYQIAAPGAVWLACQLASGKAARLGALAWGVLAALTGVYSAFFSCCSVLIGAWVGRSRQSVAGALTFFATVAIVTALSILPSLLHAAEASPLKPYRRAEDIRMYSMSFDRLCIPYAPQENHPLARLSCSYQKEFPNTTGLRESAYLGWAALAGLAALLLGLAPAELRHTAGHRRCLTLLCWGLLLLGSAEGLAPLLSLGLGRFLRCYNRASFFVAFSGLAWLALCAQNLCRERRQALAMGALCLIVGLWEQAHSLPPWDASWGLQQKFNARKFVSDMEKTVPPGAMIWTVPHTAYPESGQLWKEGEYAWAKLYLASHGLRWSWGDLKGTPNDDIIEAATQLPWNQQVPMLARNGFAGIVVLRTALHDRGAALEADLQGRGLTRTLVSPDRQFVFYPLAQPTRQQAAERKGDFAAEVEFLNQKRTPLVFGQGAGGCSTLGSGWQSPERDGVPMSGKRAEIDCPELLPPVQPSPRQPRRLFFDLELAGGASAVEQVELSCDGRTLATWSIQGGKRSRFSADLAALPCRLTLQRSGPGSAPLRLLRLAAERLSP